jgi:hypothetical protein
MDPFEEIRASIKQRLNFEAQKIDADIIIHEQALLELKAKREALPTQVFRANQKLPEKAYCPRCWIWDGVQHRLTPLDGTNTYDLFRCDQCGTEIEVHF